METTYVHERGWHEEVPVAELGDARVFNAPRPLWGERTWEGEFRHGVFYAAIFPDADRGDEMVEENARRDAVEVKFVDDRDLRRMISDRLAERGYSLADYEQAGLDINDAAAAVGLPGLHDPMANHAGEPSAGRPQPEASANTVRVLRVDVDGTREVVDVEQSLESLCSLLDGGHLELISPDPNRQSIAWSGYCDEEGKLKHLPVNAAATVLAERFGWTPWRGDVLVGPVIFLGGPDADGYETDVPEELVPAHLFAWTSRSPGWTVSRMRRCIANRP